MQQSLLQIDDFAFTAETYLKEFPGVMQPGGITSGLHTAALENAQKGLCFPSNVTISEMLSCPSGKSITEKDSGGLTLSKTNLNSII